MCGPTGLRSAAGSVPISSFWIRGSSRRAGLVVRETGLPAPEILGATKSIIAGARVGYALVLFDVRP